MSKAVVCTGRQGEFKDDEEVTDVTVADGVTEIEQRAFWGCLGLTNLSFLKGSAITTVGPGAFARTGIASLQWMEGVSKIGVMAFCGCRDLRSIEGLGCEEMGIGCFTFCRLLKSMKGWPASMTVIPHGCFRDCTEGCTSLLPPSLSNQHADPAAVLAYLKRKSKDERVLARYAIYASIRRARDQEGEPRTDESPTAFAFALAKLPPDMNRLILEFKLGVFVQR
jgi:hypothetical protein